MQELTYIDERQTGSKSSCPRSIWACFYFYFSSSRSVSFMGKEWYIFPLYLWTTSDLLGSTCTTPWNINMHSLLGVDNERVKCLICAFGFAKFSWRIDFPVNCYSTNVFPFVNFVDNWFFNSYPETLFHMHATFDWRDWGEPLSNPCKISWITNQILFDN